MALVAPDGHSRHSVKKAPDRLARALLAVEKGGSKAAAAAAAGVSRTTLNEWLEQDPDFETDFQIARGVFENDQLERINTAADIPQHWTASAWLLERTFPERYALNGPRVLSENASDTGGVIPMQIAVQIQQLLLVQQAPPERQLAAPEDVVEGVFTEVAQPAQAPVLKQARVVDPPPLAPPPIDLRSALVAAARK